MRCILYKLILDQIPPSLNKFAGRKNVWEYRELKQFWKQLICLKSLKAKPKFPIAKATVHLHYIFPTRVRHDPDNYNGKMILDGLVEAKIIQDDSFNCINLKLSAEYQKGITQTVIEICEE